LVQTDTVLRHPQTQERVEAIPRPASELSCVRSRSKGSAAETPKEKPGNGRALFEANRSHAVRSQKGRSPEHDLEQRPGSRLETGHTHTGDTSRSHTASPVRIARQSRRRQPHSRCSNVWSEISRCSITTETQRTQRETSLSSLYSLCSW